MSEPTRRSPVGSSPVGSSPVGGSVRRRPPVAMLVLLVALLAVPVEAAPAAEAATAPLQVTLTDLTVTGSAPTSPVVVSGTVTNRSAAPVFDVRASLWRSTAQLRSLGAVQDALAADASPAGGVLRNRAGETDAITTPTTPLASGASGSFTVSGTLADLGFARDASYWVGARVTAATKANGAWTVGPVAAKTLATIPAVAGTPVVTVVELATTPRRLRRGLFTDDGLAAELAPAGRLGRLLALAAQPGVSWVVDPSLVADVNDMATGYKVVDGTASKPGAGQQAAADWLAAFKRLPGSGYQTLYGRPDLAGAAAAGTSSVLDRALAASTASGLNLPVVAVSARVSEAALTALGRAGVPALTSLGAGARPWQTMAGAHVIAAVSLSTPVASTVLSDSPLSRRNVTLALARAAGGQVRLIADPNDEALDDAASPAWVVRRGVADVLAQETSAGSTAPAVAAASGALTAQLVTRLDRLARDLRAYGSAAPATGLAALADALSSNGASEAWLADPAGRTAYLGLLESRSGTALLGSGVTITAAQTVTLASDSSPFPATIANHLPDAIKVRVVGVSDNGARLAVRPSDWVTILPNDNLTVLLTATAAGKGVVGVSLHVETPDGLTVSAPARLSIEATSLGVLSWVIVAASGAMLVVTTALRIRQVRLRRSR